MGAGDVKGLIRFHGKRQAHKLGLHGIFRGGLGINCKHFSRFKSRNQIRKRIHIEYRLVFLFGKIGLFRKVLLQLPEFQFFKKGGEPVIVRRL